MARKRELVKRVGGMLWGGVVMVVVLTACGGSAGGSALTLPANPQPAAQPAQAAPAAPESAQPTASAVQPASPQPAAQPANKATSDLVAQGALIFQMTAGGVGCASCHGLDGSGRVPGAAGAPDIRGASEAKVRAALGGGVPMMRFIKLTDEEFTAVAAYLKFLNEQ